MLTFSVSISHAAQIAHMSSYDCPASGWRSRQGPLDLGYVSLKVKSMQAFSLQKFDCLPNLAKHQTCQRVCSHMTLDMTKSNVSCCAVRKHSLLGSISLQLSVIAMTLLVRKLVDCWTGLPFLSPTQLKLKLQDLSPILKTTKQQPLEIPRGLKALIAAEGLHAKGPQLLVLRLRALR